MVLTGLFKLIMCVFKCFVVQNEEKVGMRVARESRGLDKRQCNSLFIVKTFGYKYSYKHLCKPFYILLKGNDSFSLPPQ